MRQRAGCCELLAGSRIMTIGLTRRRGPERPQLGQLAHRSIEPSSQPFVSHRVGMEVVRFDGQARRIEAVIGVGHVDDPRETRGLRRLDQCPLVGPVVRPPDARNQAPRRSARPSDRQSAAIVW